MPESAPVIRGKAPSDSGICCPYSLLFLLSLVVLLNPACRQDMHDQPKLKPLAKSDFYPDQRASRPQVQGTVARGQLLEDSPFTTGKVDGQLTHELPVALSAELLETGRIRFETFCAPCHGQSGSGNGLVVQRGFKKPVSFHQDRLRQAPIGYFFDVMTNGFGAMSDYRHQVRREDRWAIAAYIRTLQLSQNARIEDVPAAERARLLAPKAAAPAPEAHP